MYGTTLRLRHYIRYTSPGTFRFARSHHSTQKWAFNYLLTCLCHCV